ncbi:hypothetical protein FRB90_003624 [Tulasnella sp. 427]|nr:hypothetical protein FRB90_003624 [Tulasnella sp. 427]
MDSVSNSVTGTAVEGRKSGQPEEDAYIRTEQSQKELGTRSAEDEEQGPAGPQKFQHEFWDPEVAHLRALYMKILGLTVVLLILVMWICFPVFWGSLGETSQHVPNLKGLVINRDGADGALGQAIVAAFEANSRGEGVAPNAHLTWVVADLTAFRPNDDLAHAVVEEAAWAAVVVNPSATALLTSARSSGDSSYDPRTAISFYYNQGRNEIATNSFIVPYTTALLETTLASFNAKYNAEFFASLVSDPGQESQQALAAIVHAPQTVSQPFSFTPVNLRPYTKTASQAILLVGQIYLRLTKGRLEVVITFIITMTHDFARGVISPFIRFSSYAKMRVLVPLTLYFPISFSYALVNLPFKLTFGAKYSYAGGFFLFWIFVYMGMSALGLSVEAMITLLTPRFAAYFLVALIIFNVSVASVPIVLQPGFYRWGYGFPVFNLAQAIRTIIFNTKNKMGLNAGVLLAWIVLSSITIPIFTWLTRRKTELAERNRVKEARAKA